jgi:quercetin dioxygenase-like cupin family protein
MKKHLRLFLVAGISVVAAAALYAAQAEKAAKAKPAPAKRAVFRTPSDMKWADIPNATGAQQSVAWGNAEKGPHGAFVKFPGGTEIPLHSHTASVRSAVISGTILHALEGQPPKELGPGSYASIPGGVKHTTACKAGADCLIYSEWSAAFDLTPAQ